MAKLAGQMLTTRGVAAFWLLWSLAFVLMLWAVSPGRTLQDALAAELLQGHLAGGYQLRNPPLYEWLLWGVQQVVGPGPLSYLILRYALIATTGILLTLAVQRTVGSARVAAAFSLSLVLFFWFVAFRVFVRGGRWRHGWGGYYGERLGVPPMFDEWHRRAHEREARPASAPPAQG